MVLVSQNCLEDVVAYFAFMRLGATVVFLSPRLPARVRQRYIRQTGARHWRVWPKLNFSEPKKIDAPVYNLSAPADIMLTSGSSGEAKLVVHSVGNHYYSALGSNAHISLTKDDVWLWSLPLYHVSGLSILWRVFLAGATLYLPGKEKLAQVIAREEVTHVSLVYTQFRELASRKSCRARLRRYKAILLGGSATENVSWHKAFPLYKSYGLTEMASQVATTCRGGKRARVLKYRKVRTNAMGEIEVSGKTCFLGYFKNGRLVPQGKWFATGDLGRVGTYLTVSGRKDAMFISGGENIQPEEIERALLKCRGVLAAAVFGRTDKKYGQRPVAYVQWKKKETVSSLRRSLQKMLPAYKIPDAFFPWEARPAGRFRKNLML